MIGSCRGDCYCTVDSQEKRRLTEEGMFELRSKSEMATMPISGGRAFQKEGRARTKPKRWEPGWLIQATEQRPAGGSAVSGEGQKELMRGVWGQLTWGPILPSLGERG